MCMLTLENQQPNTNPEVEKHLELRLPEHLRAQLVQSATEILRSFVRWNSETETFERQPQQAELCLVLERSGSTAAAGVLALAEKYHLPLPQMLFVHGFGTEVIDAYTATHKKYEALLFENPEVYAKLMAEEVARVGSEASFLTWLAAITDEPDEFQFESIQHDLADTMFLTNDDFSGGFLRYVRLQLREDAPANPLKDSARAIAATGKTHITLLDDVIQRGVISTVLVPTVLRATLQEKMQFNSHDSHFVFARGSTWYDDIITASTGEKNLTLEQLLAVKEAMHGTAEAAAITGEETDAVPYETTPALGAETYHTQTKECIRAAVLAAADSILAELKKNS